MKKGVIFVAVAAFIALIWYCVRYASAPVSTFSVYDTTYEETVSADAYIVRAETVYKAPSHGTFYTSIKEGARVGNNRRISTIYASDVSEEILSELSTIDTKIEELSSIVVDGTEFMTGGASAEEKLIQIGEKIEEAAYNNDVAKIAEYKVEINNLLTGGGGTVSADSIFELQASKARVESSISAAKHDIYSGVAGIFSAKVDGYESVLTPQTIRNMTCAQFAEIQPTETKVETPDDKQTKKDSKSRMVNQGDSVCKIMDNHRWYITALVERNDIEDVKIGQKVDIRFSKLPGEITSAVVNSVSNDPQGQKQAVVVLECDTYCEGAFSIRADEIEIIKQSYTGFLVPINSIRVKESKNGVMVRSGGKEIFKPCEILYRDEKKAQAIVVPDTDDPNRTLRLYDIVVEGEK